MNPENIREELREKWKSDFADFGMFVEIETFGDGHYCVHHPDDPTHGERCYTQPYNPIDRIADWWLAKFAARDAEVREKIKAMKQIPVSVPHHSPYLSGYNSALHDVDALFDQVKS